MAPTAPQIAAFVRPEGLETPSPSPRSPSPLATSLVDPERLQEALDAMTVFLSAAVQRDPEAFCLPLGCTGNGLQRRLNQIRLFPAILDNRRTNYDRNRASAVRSLTGYLDGCASRAGSQAPSINPRLVGRLLHELDIATSRPVVGPTQLRRNHTHTNLSRISPNQRDAINVDHMLLHYGFSQTAVNPLRSSSLNLNRRGVAERALLDFDTLQRRSFDPVSRAARLNQFLSEQLSGDGRLATVPIVVSRGRKDNVHLNPSQIRSRSTSSDNSTADRRPRQRQRRASSSQSSR